jgi:glycosyltransferase involved in cell wall biosynthesis
MEESILKKADYVFTNSHYLKKYAEQYNDASFYIGQGCNLTSLSSDIENHSRPIELSGINKSIVGYIGNLVTLRLDLALLEKVAAIRNDLFWIFVGPLDDGFAKSKLKLLPNVIFTGHKAQHELANFISCFSVCINPQVLNETTIGNYPRKIDEYMLFGKPVIARKTDFTQELGNLVYQYETEQQFLEMLDLAILEDGKSDLFEERKSVAKTHTWKNSVKKIVDTVLMPKA